MVQNDATKTHTFLQHCKVCSDYFSHYFSRSDQVRKHLLQLTLLNNVNAMDIIIDSDRLKSLKTSINLLRLMIFLVISIK